MRIAVSTSPPNFPLKTTQQFLALFPLLFLSNLGAQPTPRNDATSDTSAPYVIVERGPDSQLLQRVTWSTNAENEVTATTNFVTQLETGLNYRDPDSGEWLPSEQVIELLPGGTGAVARKAPHTVVFPPSLYNGVIELTTQDGTILRSRPTLLSFFDGQNSVLLAELRDSTGYLLPSSNQVMYPNTFSDGINADLIVTFTKSGFEADVVFRSPLPERPEDFGLNADSCRLQLLTEFFDTAAPVKESETISSPDGLSDSILRFGSMRMARGKGFSVGTSAENETPVPVFKSWQILEGRSFLVEEISWRKIQPHLNNLAVASTPRVQNLAGTGSNLRRASRDRLLPPPRLAQSTTNTIQLAKADFGQSPGFILDYTILSSTNTVLKGDVTYFVSGSVSINNLEIEGGTILKFTNTSSAKITVTGTIDCQTGPYRPAVFTHYLDGSVGETIATGAITNYYGNGLRITASTNSLSNVRFAYASTAIDFNPDCSGELNLSNVQFVNCRYPIHAQQNGLFCYSEDGNFVNLNNVLCYACDYFVAGEMIYLTAQHLTVNQCNKLAWAETAEFCYGYITNCLLVAVTNLGNFFAYYTNSTVHFTNDPGGIFQTAGGGNLYLADGSTNRNAGTTNINVALLADLKTKTTYPPILLTNTISVNTTLNPQSQRDTDTPDRGYHYSPIDYITWLYTVTNATLTISNGTAIACYNDTGIWLRDGSALISAGTPLLPNWFVRYQSVQEQPVSLGLSSPSSAVSVNPYHTGAVHQAASFRFSNFAAPANGGTHLYHASPNWLYGSLLVQDCQLWGGANTLNSGDSTTAILNNNLFYRSSISASCSFTNASLTFSNNLVFGPAANVLLRSSNTNHLVSAYNNAFDSCTIGFLSTCTNGYNAYIMTTNRLNPTNANDIVMTNALGYQTGPLGNFYQPTNSSLINAGSVTNAGWVGLYHHTVTTNEVKETNSTVDIGFHPVAVDEHQQPLDYDADAVPDYAEDRNGNGTVDSGETDWQSGTMVIAWGDNSSGQCNVPAGLIDLVAVAAGQHHSLALRSNHTVVAWGGNSFGETNVPATLTNVTAIAANGYSLSAPPPLNTSQSLALSNGIVVQWGTSWTNPPGDLTDAMAIAAGHIHSLAVRSNGLVTAWGDSSQRAAQVPTNLAGVKTVAAAWNHSVALLTNGSVTAWGDNLPGWNMTNVPPDLTNAAAISASALHTLALRSNGTVVAWGYNASDQTNVPTGLSNVLAVAAGGMHSLSLLSDGTVSKWGGGVGVPAELGGVTAIAAGYQHSLAIRSGRLSPVIVQQPTNQAALAGGSVTFTVSVSGLAALYYQWQFNSNNIAGATDATLTLNNVSINSNGNYRVIVSNGAGTITSSNATFALITPPVITGQTQPDRQWAQYPYGLTLSVSASAPGEWVSSLVYEWKTNGITDATAISSSYALSGTFSEERSYSVTITNGAGSTNSTWKVRAFQPGGVVAWGTNDAGQLERPLTLTNVSVAAGGRAHCLALNDDGTLVGWGDNTYGQTNIPSGLTNVAAIAAGNDHNLALKIDSTVVAWGRNESSQTNVPSGLTNVIAVAAGGSQSLALKSNGTVTNWGASFGAIPGGATNVIAIAMGTNFSVALRSNGTVVAWGNNAKGQTNVPSGLANVVSIAAGGAHALALKADGTVVAWGSNGSGETNVPSYLTNASANAMSVAAGYAHSLALRNDGTVVGWGDNTYGQTNVGGGLTTIKSISSGGNHSLALVFSPLVQYPVDVSKDLLLIYNTTSTNSTFVKDYYLAHRPMVSNANVLGIGCTTNETFLPDEYTNVFATPVQAWLTANPTKRPSYVILFLDIPSRVNLTNQPAGYYWIDGQTPSVSYRLNQYMDGWHPFVTHINMNGTNDCKAYIDKLGNFATNALGQLFLSASNGGYSNSNYYFDDAQTGLPPLGIHARDGVLAAGVSSNLVTYVTGTNAPHILMATNVAGFFTWGYNAAMGSTWVTNGVKFFGQSGWYIIETGESYNGVRTNYISAQPIFLEWFSSIAFGGTNYSNTPIGGVTHVDEPGYPGHDGYVYFGFWARGKSFAACAWNSRNLSFDDVQVVGDPFVTR